MNKNPNEFHCAIIEKKCHKCGKIFIPGAEHVYRDHGKWYCCWTCFLHRKDKPKPPTPHYMLEGEFIIPEEPPWPKENPHTRIKEEKVK